MKLALEDRVKSKFSSKHCLITWLVSHAADLLTKIVVGRDGKTAYYRIKGKRYDGEMVEFASCVHYRVPGDTEGGT